MAAAASRIGSEVAEEASRHLERARINLARGDAGRCRADLAAGLAVAGGSGMPVEAELLVQAARLAAWRNDPPAFLAEAQRAVEAARRSATAVAEAEMLVGLACSLVGSRACLAHFRAARRAASAEGRTDTAFDAAVMAAGALQVLGKTDASVRIYESIRRAAEASRKPIWEHTAAWRAATIELLARGGTRQAIPELRRLARQRGLGLHRPQVLGDLALALADAGEPEEARSVLGEAARTASTEWTAGVAAFYRAEVEWASGRAPRALAASDEAVRLGLGQLEVVARGTRMWSLYELALPEGDPAAEEPTTPLFAGIELESRAFRALAHGNLPAAERAFVAAAERWSGMLLRCELRARWGAAETAARAGARDRARRLLLEIESRAREAGLESVAARARRTVVQHGLDPGRDGWAEARLSARQRQILLHVGRGRTTKQIAALLNVTPRTIETHIEFAMAKLGASSRIEAAVLAGAAPRVSSAALDLSDDERSLLELLARGLTLVDAVHTLGISRRTGARRLERARQALGVTTTAEAATVVAWQAEAPSRFELL